MRSWNSSTDSAWLRPGGGRLGDRTGWGRTGLFSRDTRWWRIRRRPGASTRARMVVVPRRHLNTKLVDRLRMAAGPPANVYFSWFAPARGRSGFGQDRPFRLAPIIAQSSESTGTQRSNHAVKMRSMRVFQRYSLVLQPWRWGGLRRTSSTQLRSAEWRTLSGRRPAGVGGDDQGRDRCAELRGREWLHQHSAVRDTLR